MFYIIEASIFLNFRAKKLNGIENLISKIRNKKAFIVWNKKEIVKKISPFVFDLWKNEKRII